MHVQGLYFSEPEGAGWVGPPGEDCCQLPLFGATVGTTELSVQTVGLHPGGIISPICPGISSSSLSPSANLCQYEAETFASLLPLGSPSCSHEALLLLSFVCRAHTHTVNYWETRCLLHFNTSSPLITQDGITG